MKGSLSQRCPAEILSEIQRRQASGTASFSHAGISRQLFFDAGVAIRFAASNHPAESFTAHLAAEARLGNMQMRAATEAKQPEELLGTTLVRVGIIPAADLAALTRDHIQRVAQAALAMSEGEWEFQVGALPFREQLDAGLRTAEMVLEWSRGLKDVAWIRQHLGPDESRIQRDRRPPEGYQTIRLDTAEGYIMSRVDGSATLREIGMVSPMGDERTLAALLGLALAGILEIPASAAAPFVLEVEPPAPTADPETRPPSPAGDPAATAAAGPPASAALPEAESAGQRSADAGTDMPPRVDPPPAETPAAAKTGPGAPAGVGARPRPPATGTRHGAGATRRPGDRRHLTAVRRPAPPAANKLGPTLAALPEGEQLEAEMAQRFDQMDTQDLYQVLGVSPSAQADDIRRAYYGLARRFHPDRFQKEQIKPRAEKVFGRITEAYATLSDPDVRQRYDLEEAGRAPNRGDNRPADTSDLARQNFRTGRDHLEHGHLAEALGFLINACQQDPTRPEYFELLGATQARNPRLRKDAEENLLRAIALDPSRASTHAHLGTLYARTGAADRAREMFRKALEWDPDNAIAREGLGAAEPGRKGILGLFSRRS